MGETISAYSCMDVAKQRGVIVGSQGERQTDRREDQRQLD